MRTILRRGLAMASLPFMAGSARAGQRARSQPPERFVVYYSNRAAPSDFAPYRWAVLDADFHPPLAAIMAQGASTFGYLSAGEAERNRAYFSAIPQHLLLDENPNWPGSFYADVRRPEWRALMLDRLLPELLARGFQGVFLDTLDNPPFLEARDPRRFAGMTAAAAELVLAMRARYPRLPIMLNRAYELHAAAGEAVDIVLAESLLGGYDFSRRSYVPVDAEGVRWGMARIGELQRAHPRVRVFTLDYWDPADLAGIRRLYSTQRRHGFVPYVATIDLHRIVPEPRP
jgi:polysaccharide biosynthesis protein PelA